MGYIIIKMRESNLTVCTRIENLIFNADQRLTGFYSLLFNWMAELAHEFPGYFDREDCMKWVKEMLAKELRHYHGMEDSSKNGTSIS